MQVLEYLVNVNHVTWIFWDDAAGLKKEQFILEDLQSFLKHGTKDVQQF